MLTEKIIKYLDSIQDETVELIKTLCEYPAPSGKEEKRAQFCKQWLEENGASGVYIDSALNVVYPVNCEGKDKRILFTAHTDTVFPDTESYPEYKEDDERIYCPAVGDDTVRVATVMMCAKYFIDNNITPENGVLFVLNSCEEGLGNLVGTRQLFKDFDGRITQFITVDANIGAYVNVAVGSHRYEVEAKTAGGHSYSKFGNRNAIEVISGMICEIYKLRVPEKEGAKTTYNVGIIEGGTSVNTIAQSAKMLCEYRSNDRECLAVMEKEFARIFKEAESDDAEIIVTRVGERPCKGEVDLAVEKKLIDAYKRAVQETNGMDTKASPASTDANIPMSLGIAALDVGAAVSVGSHTREEYLEKNTVAEGVEAIIRMTTYII
jgi:acetylornithine deacetylase/succinyl-diaminopimelate desuccinylase-like protein